MVASSPLTLYDKKLLERVKHIEVIYYQLLTEDAALTREIRAFEAKSSADNQAEVVVRRKMIELEEMKRRFKDNLFLLQKESQPSNQFERNVKANLEYKAVKDSMINRGNYSTVDSLVVEEALLTEKNKLKPELPTTKADKDKAKKQSISNG